MKESKAPGLTHRSAVSRQSSRFGEDFKRDAVRLVVDEKYTFPAAAKAVGVSVQSLRAWHKKFALPLDPCGESRRGNCYDNAVMERFFWSLKHEWTNHERFANLEEARLSVFRYIETFYNSERIHETLDYLSPDAYEAENAPAVAA